MLIELHKHLARRPCFNTYDMFVLTVLELLYHIHLTHCSDVTGYSAYLHDGFVMVIYANVGLSSAHVCCVLT